MTARCEIVNTYQVLEHVMGISGLHPHRLSTVRKMREKLVMHVTHNHMLGGGFVLDIGCGSGAGAWELAGMFGNGQRVIGIDIDKTAIEKARQLYSNQSNLSFFHGDLPTLIEKLPEIDITSAICISVSMFIQDVGQFYKHMHAVLHDGGMFIDAPFMFGSQTRSLPEKLRYRTYSVCGCNMKMFQSHQLKLAIRDAGFEQVDCVEHDFDLMKLKVLFADYKLSYLMRNFVRNVISPPAHFGKISSLYLLVRTLKIFYFFLANRRKYSSGELVAVKSSLLMQT